jgi:catalase
MKSHYQSTEGPYVENENSESVGVRSPLLQDYILHEKMAHFKEPPKGWYTQKVLWDIYRNARHQQIYKAKMFMEIGKETKVLLRFSTVGGEKDLRTERDPEVLQ